MILDELKAGDKFRINNQIFLVTDRTINYLIGVIDNKGEIHYLYRDVSVQKLEDVVKRR